MMILYKGAADYRLMTPSPIGLLYPYPYITEIINLRHLEMGKIEVKKGRGRATTIYERVN
jgi:hypothetical protein